MVSFFHVLQYFSIDVVIAKVHTGLLQVLELLEQCWNLKCQFKGAWNSLNMSIFTWKLIEVIKICGCLLFTLFAVITNTKNGLKKYPKRKFEEIVHENSWYAKKYFVFCILGFLYIHACAVNVNLELLANLYFSPLLVLENFLKLHMKILHEPCA